MISLETRASLVTERADVVFPVSLIEERAGSFVNWEGRAAAVRGRDHRADQPMSDLRVLAALADGLGVRSRLPHRRRGAGRAARSSASGTATRAAAPAPSSAGEPAGPDGGAGRAGDLAACRSTTAAALDGEPYLLATARPPVARLSPRGRRRAGRRRRSRQHRPRFADAARGRRARHGRRAWSGCRADGAGHGVRSAAASAAGGRRRGRRSKPRSTGRRWRCDDCARPRRVHATTPGGWC